MNTTEIKKEDIFNYLELNSHRPIYIVRNNEFIMSLLRTSEGKYFVTSYLHQDETGDPLTKEVEVDNLRHVNRFKVSDRFLTSLGALQLLNFLEKK